MKLKQLFLSEVFVIGDITKSHHQNVIAHKQWIWVLDEFMDEKEIKKIAQKLKLGDVDDVEDLYQAAEDTPDILTGVVDGDYLDIRGGDVRHSTLSSTLLKTLKALKLKGTSVSFYDDSTSGEDSFVEDRYEFLQPIAKQSFYHGTSYNFVKDISRLGIKSVKHTNFEKIKHEDKVFVTANKDKALFHSVQAASVNNSVPVILELKIPDPNKLVLDYDIAISVYGKQHKQTIKLGYGDIKDYLDNEYGGIIGSAVLTPVVKRHKDDKGGLNTKLGIFGYVGRIPAKFIKNIWVDTNAFGAAVASDIYGIDPSDERIEPLSMWDSYTFKSLADYRDEVEDELEEILDEE